MTSAHDVRPSQRGEVCIRGPNIMKGYLNKPDATAECIDRMGELHELLGHNRQLFMFDLGGISDGELEETVRRFGEEVLPHLPD